MFTFTEWISGDARPDVDKMMEIIAQVTKGHNLGPLVSVSITKQKDCWKFLARFTG